MLENYTKFLKDVSLDRLKIHCRNDNINLTEENLQNELTGKFYTCGILLGNKCLQTVLVVKFNTLNMLTLSSNVFVNSNDSQLFEETKDFVKEFCNFLAGHLKGVMDNAGLHAGLSLPVMASQIDPVACFGNGKSTHEANNRWWLYQDIHFVELSCFSVIKGAPDDLLKDFLDTIKFSGEVKKNNIEFF